MNQNFCLFRVSKNNISVSKWQPYWVEHISLKGLSHEIDFKNVDQTLKNLT
jgi:hypothetical protein